ncbi:MAG: arylsulfatase, partial [Verrucomicrobiae bacterium]|nr:arylsulfatase [Verrucomicrobiae bacterium]NNJ87615.1 arylsulfatase [Akkermansiaceae bacterium]
TSQPSRDNGGEDSVSLLPVFEGKPKTERAYLVSHSVNGSFAIRKGNWKLLMCPGSGGWSTPRPRSAWKDKNLHPVQLYDLAADPAETNNLATKHPDQVKSLMKLLLTAINNGRSTPGKPQPNDGDIPAFHKRIKEAYPDIMK